jgi:hypothetical protein
LGGDENDQYGEYSSHDESTGDSDSSKHCSCSLFLRFPSSESDPANNLNGSKGKMFRQALTRRIFLRHREMTLTAIAASERFRRRAQQALSISSTHNASDGIGRACLETGCPDKLLNTAFGWRAGRVNPVRRAAPYPAIGSQA